jgi:hypothetical protein
MHQANLNYFLLGFGSQGLSTLGRFYLPPTPHKAYLSRLLAGLRIYSPDTSLLDSRLLQLKECLSLIRLVVIVQRLRTLVYKDFVSKLFIYRLANLKGIEPIGLRGGLSLSALLGESFSSPEPPNQCDILKI